MSEAKYKEILNNYLIGSNNVDQFIKRFMEQWRIDRDVPVHHNPKFQRLIDRLFTRCDCYSEEPDDRFEIDEKVLKSEVELLYHIWFG